MAKTVWVVLGSVVAVGTVGAAIALFNKDDIIDKVQDNISVNVSKIESKFGAPNSKFPVYFTITNDNAIGAKNISIEGELYYEGQRLGKFDRTTPFDLGGKETSSEQSLEVNVNLFDLVGNLVNIITNGSFSNKIEVRFTAYSSLPIPSVRGTQLVTVTP